jgi:imidazole glycerol-phosphate synthase subunit HisH
MTTIIDYGMGNLGSIVNTFRRIGVSARVTSDPDTVRAAKRLVLPGVGSFKRGMENLRGAGLIPALEEQVLENEVPILGICLGMQLFSEQSEEGDVRGLGWIKADTVRFQFGSNGSRLKIPHMGWNAVNANGDPLLAEITVDDRFYFVHSYHLAHIEEELVIGATSYGYDFPSVIRQGNIRGIQCHPERSHSSGVRVLKNFMDLH